MYGQGFEVPGLGSRFWAAMTFFGISSSGPLCVVLGLFVDLTQLGVWAPAHVRALTEDFEAIWKSCASHIHVDRPQGSHMEEIYIYIHMYIEADTNRRIILKPYAEIR